MNTLIDMTGMRFGRLVVEERGPNKGRATAWFCRCDCGKRTHVRAGALRSGNTRSCGCLVVDTTRAIKTTHGFAAGRGKRKIPSEYNIWGAMKSRCYSPTDEQFAHYGGRGITVCARWRDDFSAFYDDMGPRPSRRHSIDRIDNDGPYSPENCRWSTQVQQANNKRNNIVVTYNGREMTLAQVARAEGVDRRALRSIYVAHGIPIENAVDMVRYGRQIPQTSTHCKNGHPFNAEHTEYQSSGHRRCRTCREAKGQR